MGRLTRTAGALAVAVLAVLGPSGGTLEPAPVPPETAYRCRVLLAAAPVVWTWEDGQTELLSCRLEHPAP